MPTSAIKKKLVPLPDQFFSREFEELYKICEPHMSEFLRGRLKKLRTAAEKEGFDRRRELEQEAFGFMANGLEFAIANQNRKDQRGYVRKLIGFLDLAQEENDEQGREGFDITSA